MALNGSFNTSGYEGRYLTFSWSVTNTQADRIANNRSVISWTLKGAGTGQAGWYMAGNFKVVIAGRTVYSSANRIQLYNGTTVASGSVTINHKTDGTQGFTASAEAGIYNVAVNCRGSGTFTLDTIPRTSTLTVGNGTVGSALSFKINKASSGFKHRIQYWCGSLSGYVAGSASAFTTATDLTWTVPANFATQNTKGSTVQVKFTLGTYTSGGDLVGYTNKTITCTIPTTSAFMPRCSFTLDDVTGIDDIYGSPVQSLSSIKVTVSTTPAYGSAITSCVISVNGVKYNGLTATTGALPYSGNAPVVVTVTDGRGRTGTASYTMRVQEYRRPSIPLLTVHRCDASGTESPQGEYIKAYFEASVHELGGPNNTATYTLRYREYNAAGTQDFTEVTFPDLVNSYDVAKTYIFAADTTSSYDVEVEAQDAHGSTVRSTTAPTAFALFNVGEDGESLCFGGVAEEPGAIQNNMVGIQRGNSYCFSSPGVAGSAGYVLMARIEIVEPYADTPITFIFTRRSARTPMTVHVNFESVATLTPLNAYCKYEGTNYGAYLCKTGDSVWELYVQKVSAYDTITLQDWFTSKTMGNRVKVTFPGTLVSSVPTPWVKATPPALQNILDYIYPVGSVVIRYDHHPPSDLFGGTWVRIANRFLWAVDNTGNIGTTGGAKEVTLTTSQIPAHSHGSVYSQHVAGVDKTRAWYSDSGSSLAYGPVYAGGGQPHNNMPPYIQVSVWRRTA